MTRQFPPLPKCIRGAIADYRVLHSVEEQDIGKMVGQHDGHSPKGPAIRIQVKALNPGARWQTFFHEILHKWATEAGVNLKDTDENPEVDRLATAILADFLRNNWKLPGEK